MDEVLINLRVLSYLQPYQRVNTRQLHFRIYERGFFPEWLSRFLDGATRRADFGRIRDIYTVALENLEHPGMKTSVKNSRKGLENLMKTYENDQTMIARIETLLERIDATV